MGRVIDSWFTEWRREYEVTIERKIFRHEDCQSIARLEQRLHVEERENRALAGVCKHLWHLLKFFSDEGFTCKNNRNNNKTE